MWLLESQDNGTCEVASVLCVVGRSLAVFADAPFVNQREYLPIRGIGVDVGDVKRAIILLGTGVILDEALVHFPLTYQVI